MRNEEREKRMWIYTGRVTREYPLTQPPRRPIDRLKEWVEQLGQWVDGLVQTDKPELIPVPVRRPDRRRR